MLLAPAVLTWLGDRAWGLPRWLDRLLPHVDLGESRPEGEAPLRVFAQRAKPAGEA
jgi:RND superfamily putative drug exporter